MDVELTDDSADVERTPIVLPRDPRDEIIARLNEALAAALAELSEDLAA